MIKIAIKNKNLLNEAMLKFSKQAQEKIVSYVTQAIENKSTNSRTIIDIPLKDIIYSNNKNFYLGLPFLYYGNIKNEFIPNNEIISNWNEKEKKFDDNFIANILNNNCELVLRIDNNPNNSAIASMGAATSANKTVFVMSFFLPNIKNIESVKNFARHELQHLTQKLNNTCILYAEKLKRTYNPQRVKIIKMNLKKTKNLKFGLGKEKTGIKKSTSSNVKKKIGSDIEYETYLSDLVTGYYNKISTIVSSENLAPNQLAVKYTKLFFDKYRFEKGYEKYNLITSVLSKKRPKEFVKDFLLSFEELLD